MQDISFFVIAELLGAYFSQIQLIRNFFFILNLCIFGGLRNWRSIGDASRTRHLTNCSHGCVGVEQRFCEDRLLLIIFLRRYYDFVKSVWRTTIRNFSKIWLGI